jgi:Rad3-related DNA helicase
VKLPEFASFITRIFSLGLQDDNVYDLFRLFVQRTSDNIGLVLNYWCFSAKVAMRILQKKNPLSIILASGTLSPINNFMDSMGM